MTPSVREMAQAANAAGFCVLPAAADGSKRPDVPSWRAYQEARPSNADLKQWFPEAGDRAGLGYVCGRVSGGLEVLDFDDRGAIVPFKELAENAGLDALWRRVEAGYCEETPGGGAHWFYRVAEPLGNTKLASRPCPGPPECTKHEPGRPHVLIETRGEGGWVVVAPSGGGVHESGPYVLRSGGPAEVTEVTIEERDELWAIARLLHELPVASPERDAAPVDLADPRPGDRFNAEASWSDVLVPHGWVRVHRRGVEDYWRRPGKQRGISATTNYRGSGLLYVFSTSVAEFETEQGYSKFRAYALLNHGGDWGAAARELSKDDYVTVGELVPPSADVGSVDGGTSTSRDEHRVERSEAYCFDTVFPPGHFVRRYIDYASQRTDAPHEYHETAALLLLSCASAGVRIRGLAPWPDGLPANLYAVLVGDSTRSRKSTSLDIAENVLLAAIEDAKIADTGSPEGRVQDIAQRSGQAAIWISDEFGLELREMQTKKYREGDKKLLTTIYGGKNYTHRRHDKRIKGGAIVQDADVITDPHFCILGATTPAVFDDLTETDVTSGLLPRFAWVYPRRLPPRRRADYVAPELDDEKDWLVEHVRRLYDWATHHEANVHFDAGALDELDSFEQKIEDSGLTILARLPAMAYKLSLLSALGEGVPGSTTDRVVIEARDAHQAVAVADRWRRDALEFGDRIGTVSQLSRQVESHSKKALRLLGERGGECTRRDVMRALRLAARDMDDLERTLVLSQEIEVVKAGTGGRPLITWKQV